MPSKSVPHRMPRHYEIVGDEYREKTKTGSKYRDLKAAIDKDKKLLIRVHEYLVREGEPENAAIRIQYQTLLDELLEAM